MNTLEEALKYATKNTTVFTMSYKGNVEFNYQGLSEKMKEFLDDKKN